MRTGDSKNYFVKREILLRLDVGEGFRSLVVINFKLINEAEMELLRAPLWESSIWNDGPRSFRLNYGLNFNRSANIRATLFTIGTSDFNYNFRIKKLERLRV